MKQLTLPHTQVTNPRADRQGGTLPGPCQHHRARLTLGKHACCHGCGQDFSITVLDTPLHIPLDSDPESWDECDNIEGGWAGSATATANGGDNSAIPPDDGWLEAIVEDYEQCLNSLSLPLAKLR